MRAYQSMQPMIGDLKTDALKERHWRGLVKKLNIRTPSLTGKEGELFMSLARVYLIDVPFFFFHMHTQICNWVIYGMLIYRLIVQ